MTAIEKKVNMDGVNKINMKKSTQSKNHVWSHSACSRFEVAEDFKTRL